MTLIRAFEERIHGEFGSGEIPGFVHLYAGEEAVATGVCMHLGPKDTIASTHRGHGHCIAKGCDVHGMMAEIYGKKSGNELFKRLQGISVWRLTVTSQVTQMECSLRGSNRACMKVWKARCKVWELPSHYSAGKEKRVAK